MARPKQSAIDPEASVFRDMVDVIPHCADYATVEHFVVSRDDASLHNVRCSLHNQLGDRIQPGRYARLKVNGQVVMSDTPMERRSNTDAVARATGDVLIGGLGLGMILLPILAKPDVSSVTVVEHMQCVIDLIEPRIRAAIPDYRQKSLMIAHGDVKTWKPAAYQRFDYAYLDIWPTICGDDYKEHVALRKRWKEFLNAKSFSRRVDSWMFDRVEREARR